MKTENKNMVNMTEGPILITLLSFALPIMIGNLFSSLYNLADMTIAGYTIGDDALAAISATTAIFNFIMTTSQGFNIGNSITVSNAFGAGDLNRTRKSLAGMFSLCIFVSVTMTLLLSLLIRPLMRLINTPDTIFENAWKYIIVIILGLTFTMAYNLYACAFRALGNSRIPLLLLILCSILNIILDCLFMAVLNLGVTGAALATILSQALSAVISALLFWKMYPELHFRKEDFTGISRLMLDMFPLGFSSALTNSMYAIGWIFMQASINALGQETLVAYAAHRKVHSFTVIPSVAVANALATFAAQNYGAKKLDRITKGIRQGFLFNLFVNIFTILIVRFFGRDIIQFITNTESERIVTMAYDICCITVSFVWAQTAIMGFRMSIQGMRRKVIPIMGTFFELLIRAFFALFVIHKRGYKAIGWAEVFCWVLGGIMMLICYFIVLKEEKEKYESAAAAQSDTSVY